jgi:hypothetical protein
VERSPLRLEQAGHRGIAGRPLQVEKRAHFRPTRDGEIKGTLDGRTGADLLRRFPYDLRQRHHHCHQ